MTFLGLGHFSFLELDPIGLVRLAGATGFRFVGLRLHPVAPGQVHYCPASPDEVAILAGTLKDEGVTLYDVETIVIDDTFDPESIRPMIDIAATLGAERLNVCAEDWDRAALVDTFANLCDIADEVGMAVDLEPMAWRGINTPAKCRAVLDASKPKNAGYLTDALHHFRCGGTLEDFAAFSPKQLKSVQLCDAPAAAPATPELCIAEARGGRMIPGEGELDLRGLIKAIPDDAVLSVELPMAHDRRTAVERARDIFRSTIALVESQT